MSRLNRSASAQGGERAVRVFFIHAWSFRVEGQLSSTSPWLGKTFKGRKFLSMGRLFDLQLANGSGAWVETRWPRASAKSREGNSSSVTRSGVSSRRPVSGIEG